MNARTFFDTNVLVYLFDRNEPAKRSAADQLFWSELHAGRIVVSTQVLQEFYVSVTRKLKYPLPEDKAWSATQAVARLPVVQVDPPLILAAIELSQRHRFSFWDALIVESALAAGCGRLLTEDLQHGRRFGELVIENPFLAA